MDADLRYPIGKFQPVEDVTDIQRRALIDAIAETPKKLKAAVAGLDEAQLDTPYRPGGWTVRQVIHHVPDSHMNSYVRFKMGFALYPREELAKDANVIADGHGFGGMTLAYNARNREEVDSVLAQAQSAGARILKPAQD